MVAPGEVAVVHYVGRLEADGEPGPVFDTSDVDVALESGAYDAHRDYQPLAFEVGAGEVLPGLDEAVRTMAVGEERTVTLEPAAAFGRRSTERVVEIPRETLESRSGRRADPWRLVRSEAGDVGWITDVSRDTVTVDFNHDLAGERLVFELRLLEVREGPAEDPATP